VEERFLQHAVDLAVGNVRSGRGGPFGAVVVLNGVIVGEGANSVTRMNDPSAHAEVLAIREACAKLGVFHLDGAELYTSCEPCPMCLGAIYWAHIARVYFASTQADASAAGFDDSFIYREIAVAPALRQIPMVQGAIQPAGREFAEWVQSGKKTEY
jgi:guanine deaminase